MYFNYLIIKKMSTRYAWSYGNIHIDIPYKLKENNKFEEKELALCFDFKVEYSGSESDSGSYADGLYYVDINGIRALGNNDYYMDGELSGESLDGYNALDEIIKEIVDTEFSKYYDSIENNKDILGNNYIYYTLFTSWRGDEEDEYEYLISEMDINIFLENIKKEYNGLDIEIKDGNLIIKDNEKEIIIENLSDRFKKIDFTGLVEDLSSPDYS